MPARTLFWTCALTFSLATAAHAAITISSHKTKDESCTAGICTPTGPNPNIQVKDLEKLLAQSDVRVVTGQRSTGIGVLAPLTWASSHRLTLDANQSIHIRQPIVVEGTGGATLITNDGGTGGDYYFDAPGSLTFWDTASSLVINGKAFALVKDIDTLSSDIAANPSGNYALADSYDAAADGSYAQSPIDTIFTGAFEGLGNAISNLAINDPTPSLGDQIGLFRSVDTGGSLRNISLKNLNIYAGGSFTSVGGLAGALQGVTVSAASASGSIVAGFGSRAGGLIGTAGENTLIANSHATGSVKAGTNSFAGGLIGSLLGETTGSWATGSVSIGKSHKSKPPAAVGGLVGYAVAFPPLIAKIANCYATGAVSGRQRTDAGGLVGVTFGATEITTSYASGSVRAGHRGLEGGFAGNLWSLDVADDYWNITTSGLTKGDGQGNIDGITGLTDAQLKSALPAGFDPNVWGQDPNINNGWPYLLANPPPQ